MYYWIDRRKEQVLFDRLDPTDVERPRVADNGATPEISLFEAESTMSSTRGYTFSFLLIID